MNILIILLGCNIHSILMNRIETSFKYVDFIQQIKTLEIKTPEIKTPEIKITWFLSGGIKNIHFGEKSEASIMKSYIDNNINTRIPTYTETQYYSKSPTNIKWDFVLDELSTNTAENFIRASQFLNQSSSLFDSVYIVTSKFHYKRASKMIELIDPSRHYNWILGDKELEDSEKWEQLHIQNIYSDISKAFEILNL